MRRRKRLGKNEASRKREKVLSRELRKDQVAKLEKVSEDHLTTLNFHNRLPDIPVDPKVLADPAKIQDLTGLFLPDKQLMMNTFESGRFDQKVTVNSDIGLPLDFVDMEAFGTHKRWMEYETKKVIHPDDLLLLEDSDEEKERTVRHYGMLRLMAKHGWIQALDLIDNNLTKDGMGTVSESRMHDDSVKELEQIDRLAKLGLLQHAQVLLKLGVKDDTDLYKPELKDKLRAHLGEVEAAALCAKIDAIARRAAGQEEIHEAVAEKITKTFEHANAETVDVGERLYDRTAAEKDYSLGWVQVTRKDDEHVYVRPVVSKTNGSFRKQIDISTAALDASEVGPDNQPEWKWSHKYARRVKAVPVHPTMPHRRATKVWSLLPAEELWLHKYAYVLMANQDPVSFAKQRPTETKVDARKRLERAVVRRITQEQWGLSCSLGVPRPEPEQEKAREKYGEDCSIYEEVGRFTMSIDSETDHALNPVMVTLGDTAEADEDGIQRGTAEYFYMRNSVSLRNERRPVKKMDQLRGPASKASAMDWKMLRRDMTVVERQKYDLRQKYLRPDFNAVVDSDEFDDSEPEDDSSDESLALNPQPDSDGDEGESLGSSEDEGVGKVADENSDKDDGDSDNAGSGGGDDGDNDGGGNDNDGDGGSGSEDDGAADVDRADGVGGEDGESGGDDDDDGVGSNEDEGGAGVGSNEDEGGAGGDDEEGAGGDDEEGAGGDDEEGAGEDDEEGAGGDDEEGAGGDDEEVDNEEVFGDDSSDA